MKAELFSVRLKQLREEVGLTQNELADKAGVSRRAVSHWEQGLREPAWSNVVRLAEALGVDCRAFLEESGKATPELVGLYEKAKPLIADLKQCGKAHPAEMSPGGIALIAEKLERLFKRELERSAGRPRRR